MDLIKKNQASCEADLHLLREHLMQGGHKVPEWTQGFGSNFSVKSGEYLFIKASGKRLDAGNQSHAVACLNPLALRQTLLPLTKHAYNETDEQPYSNAIKEATLSFQGQSGNSIEGLRGSMESGFHVLLPHRFVFHFHSLLTIGVLSNENGLKALENCCAQVLKNFKIYLVECVRPGLELTLAIEKERQLNPSPTEECTEVYFLKNHGVVLASNHSSLLASWEQIEHLLLAQLNRHDPQFLNWTLHLKHENISNLLAQFSDSFTPLNRPQSKEGRGLLPLFPDFSVFLTEPALTKNQILSLSQSSTLSEKNLFELIWANLLLSLYFPNLPEIPLHLSSAIQKLPTEKFRTTLTASPEVKL